MIAETLEGESVVLERVSPDDVDELLGHLQDRRFYLEAGLHRPPKREVLLDDLTEGELGVWRLIPSGEDKAIGYAGIIGYSGPPYAFVYYFDANMRDLDLAQEAMALVVKAFFEHISDQDQLWAYQDKPVDDEVHSRLVEGGFDLVEDEVPGIDGRQVACYLMERHTYAAYYGDGDDEDGEVMEEY